MLKLVQLQPGLFDLAFDDPEVGDDDTAVATLIYAALFTDAEAPDGRVDSTYDRRGWFADANAGSGLWYVRRQGLSPEARIEALTMVRMALATRSPALTDVDVAEVFDTSGSGNVSSVSMVISGLHNGRKFLVRASLDQLFQT
jgi:phage gp46-like protein